jgi:hypothetical protein
MTSTTVPTELVRSAQTYFGKWKTAIRELDVKQKRKDYTETASIHDGYVNRRRWSDDAIKEALVYAIDNNMTPTEFRERYGSMGDSIDRRFGGVLKACEHFGLPKLRRDSTDAYKFAGYAFEELVGKLFTELGMDIAKQQRFEDCIPDFVRGSTWYDAKLSEWTIHTCDTVRKYESNCRELIIVFLRGNTQTDRMVSDKTRLVHVSYFVNQLPREKRGFFLWKFSEIERYLSGEEVA